MVTEASPSYAANAVAGAAVYNHTRTQTARQNGASATASHILCLVCAVLTYMQIRATV
jgi:hypothetical protein